MDEKMMRERIRSLEEHTDKLVAQKDALMAKLDVWERTGNAIMLCVVGREAPLSDSDVCGEINALRQQVAELQAWKDAVPVQSLVENFYSAYARTGGNEDTRSAARWFKAIGIVDD